MKLMRRPGKTLRAPYDVGGRSALVAPSIGELAAPLIGDQLGDSLSTIGGQALLFADPSTVSVED
jgi:hypothetical protein